MDVSAGNLGFRRLGGGVRSVQALELRVSQCSFLGVLTVTEIALTWRRTDRVLALVHRIFYELLGGLRLL